MSKLEKLIPRKDFRKQPQENQIVKNVGLIFLILFLGFTNTSYSQKDYDSTSVSNVSLEETRIVFFSLGSGYPEYFNMKLGYQINPGLSVAIKAAIYYDGKDGYFGTGIWGIRVSKYFNLTYPIINNVSLDVGYDKEGAYDNYAYDISIGYESNSDTFLKPFWAICISSIKSYKKEVFTTLGLKVGLNFNF
jgi:hypothetical protein